MFTKVFTSKSHQSVLASMHGEFVGMREAVEFIRWMSTKEKNAAIKASYLFATKAYRKALKADTPKSKYPSKAHNPKPLYKTIGMKPSIKYGGNNTLVTPTWIGHLFRNGAYHQHLVVRGTKAWKQDDKPLQRRPKGRSKKRLSYFTFRAKSGAKAYGFKKKAVRGNNYVQPLKERFEPHIVSDFGDDFVKAMVKESKKAKYKGVFR